MVLGMSPLVTSALRLVVIATLYAANLAALCRAFRLPKFSGLLSYRRVTILTILMLNLVYLTVIWAPFTITTFKHNLQERRPEGMERVVPSSPGISEYIVRRDPDLLLESRFDRMVMEETLFDAGYYDPQELPTGFSQPTTSPQSDLGESLKSWITGVQDLITSSFTYSLVLTLLVEKIMKEKRLVVGLLQASLGALLLVVTPVPLTLSLRALANTTDMFALHTPEIKSGYTLYSIICDVHVTEAYVVGLFLELTMVLLVVVVVAVITTRRYKSHQEKESDICPRAEDDPFRVEDLACNFVLWTGAGWAWPVKPLVIIVLFLIHGPHWNNAICWLSNMAVAIPVAFMPLAVFLARATEPDTSSHTFKNSDGSVQDAVEEDSAQIPDKTDVYLQCSALQDVSLASADSSVPIPITHKEIVGKRSQLRENLKFYLGADIFKSKGKKEDEVCILSNQDGNESIV